jgi:hypothetical protein
MNAAPATSDASPAVGPGRAPAVWTLALLAAFSLAVRLWALGGTSPDRLRPDEAHALNVARCFARGQGFSNVEAWPAWLRPARLPTPETFKEPGYPFLVAALTPKDGDLHRTAIGIALIAGVLVPLVLWALARRLDPDPRVAWLAALLAAASPLLVTMSVSTLVETCFALVVTTMFLAAVPPNPGAARPWWRDAAAGALFGLAYLLRAQVTLALPALLLLMALGRSRLALLRRGALALVAALAVMSPLIVRNLREFGVPFFSNVTTYGLWPYVDQIQFSHGLEHPPAALPFALHHVPEIARHWVASLVRFSRFNLSEDVLGNPIWTIPFVAGALIAIARWRALGFAALYLATTLGFIFAVHWASYYFTSLTPSVCLITAAGGLWLWRALAERPIAGPFRGAHLLIGAAVVAFVLQAHASRREARAVGSLEIQAAQHEVPFLREHLAPDESVMVLVTSFWAWYADRPAVHLVIADDQRLAEVFARLKVRYAALPTSRLPEFAAHYPGGRLPAALVVDHELPEYDFTVFRVVASPAQAPSRTP